MVHDRPRYSPGRLSLQLGIDQLHTRHGQSALAAGRQQVAEIARTDDHHHDDVRPRLLETRVPEQRELETSHTTATTRIGISQAPRSNLSLTGRTCA